MLLIKESDLTSPLLGKDVLEETKKPLFYFKLVGITPKVLGARLLDQDIRPEFTNGAGYILCGSEEEVKDYLVKIITQCVAAVSTLSNEVT